MNLRTSLVLVAFAGIASLACAQSGPVKGRSFTYTSADAVNSDYSSAGTVSLKSATNVVVNPYLYIVGDLSANWTIDGWGVGSDKQTNSIRFYHNETLTLQLDGFGDVTKTSGTGTGTKTIAMQADLSFVNDATGKQLFDSSLVPAAKLNGMFQPSGPHFDALTTGGVMRLDFTKQISITPEVGPGTYQNVGTITIIRN